MKNLKFTGKFLQQMESLTYQSVDEVIAALDDEKSGGVLQIYRVMKDEDGLRALRRMAVFAVNDKGVDDIDELEDAAERRRVVSERKATTLVKAYKRNQNIVSSFHPKIHKSKQQEWGGAFVLQVNVLEFGGTTTLIITFSGLSEKGDEAVGIRLAHKLGWGDKSQFLKVTRYSLNDLKVLLAN